jgi:hypothetical protein
VLLLALAALVIRWNLVNLQRSPQQSADDEDQ